MSTSKNTKRSVFSIDGVTGMLIATLLLLVVLTFLSILAVMVQRENSSSYYTITNPQDIKMFGTDASKHYKLLDK